MYIKDVKPIFLAMAISKKCNCYRNIAILLEGKQLFKNGIYLKIDVKNVKNRLVTTGRFDQYACSSDRLQEIRAH